MSSYSTINTLSLIKSTPNLSTFKCLIISYLILSTYPSCPFSNSYDSFKYEPLKSN